MAFVNTKINTNTNTGTSTSKKKLKDELRIDGTPAIDNAVELKAPQKDSTGYSPTYSNIANNNTYETTPTYNSSFQNSDLANKFLNSSTQNNSTSDSKTYSNPYSAQIQNLLNGVDNMKFQYNMESDPSYQAYKNAYTNQASADYSNNLAGMATLTGGIPSSYAGSVASQARASTMQGLNDRIPQLMEAAYARYDAERNNKMNSINTLAGLNDSEYSKYSNDRDFSYNQAQNDKNFSYNALTNDRDFNYNKVVNDRDFSYNQDTDNRNFNYQKDRDNVSDSQWQAGYNADESNRAFNNSLSTRQQQFNEDTYNQEYSDSRSDLAYDRQKTVPAEISDGEFLAQMKKDIAENPNITAEDWVNEMAGVYGMSRETIDWLLERMGIGGLSADLGLEK